MSEDTTAGPGDDTTIEIMTSSGTVAIGTFHTGKGGDQASATNKLSAAERSRQALELRLRRVSYDEIARQLGYSHRSAARKAVEREIAKVPREPAKELLAQELETLDAVQRRLMPMILDPRPDRDGYDKGPDLWTVDRVVAIMDRRAKLMGLDKIGDDSGIEQFREVLKAWGSSLAEQVAKDDAEDAAAADAVVTDESQEDHA